MDPVVLMLLDFTPNQTRTFESFLLQLVEALRGNGWRTAFAFSGEPSRDFNSRLEELGATWRTASFPLRRQGVKELSAGLHPRPSVMLTAFMSPFNRNLVQLRRALGGCSWIVYDHSSGAPSQKSWPKRQAARLRGMYFGYHIARILTVSEFIARRDAEFLPEKKIRVVLNGVDLERFRPVANVPQSAARLTVSFVGQLIPEKGIRTLLRAIRSIVSSNDLPPFDVKIAGAGRLESEIREFCRNESLQNVQLLGQIKNVQQLYVDSDIVVVPSEWEEACALVVIEAMASGACLIVSDAGGNPELVGRSEEGGLLFRRGDAEEFASKLRRLLTQSELRSQLHDAARRRAEAKFSLSRVVDEVSDEITQVASNR